MSHGRDCLLALIAAAPILTAPIPEPPDATPAEMRPVDGPAIPDSWPYQLAGGLLSYERITQTKDGVRHTKQTLANFDAWISEDRILDDGTGDEVHNYWIEGRVAQSGDLPATALPAFDLPADQFRSLDWVSRKWGSRALIFPGTANREQLAVAIQSRTSPRQHTVYAHTGWRRFGETWRYLHGRGALGEPGVQVAIRGGFERFGLPERLDPVKAHAGARHLFWILQHVGPLDVMAPLFASIFRAPVCHWLPAPLTLYLLGHTGTAKSTLAALTLSAYGNFPDKTALAVDWSSTANSIEDLLFTFADHLFVADDIGRSGDPRLTQEKLDRVVRAQGNLSGRRRMRRDGTLVPVRPPRGLLLITAEVPVLDEGLMARIYQLEIQEGAIRLSGTKKPLDEAQRPDRLATLPHALGGYLEWLAAQIPDGLARELERLYERVRPTGGDGAGAVHGRLPENFGHVLVGLRLGFDYLVAQEVLEASEAEEHYQAAREAMTTSLWTQARGIRDRRVTHQFLGTLQALLQERRLCLVPRSTRPEEHKPPPTMVGWYDDTYLHLMPRASTEIYRTARDGGESMPIPEARVFQELVELGICEPGKDHVTVPTEIAGKSRRVYKLRREALHRLMGVEFDVSDSSGPPPSQWSQGEF